LPDNSPFDEAFLRQLHDQLQKLQGLLIYSMPELQAQVVELKATVAREQENREKAFAAEQEKSAAIAIERDTFKSQAEFYKAALDAGKKHRSFGCWMKKIFSAGISGCR
jgi:hypothetical protein